MVQHDIAIVFEQIGRREGSPDQLRRAAVAYRACLEVITRDAAPRQWDIAQHNFGTLLSHLAHQTDGTDELLEAAAALELALEVRTYDSSPFEWAMTLNNLGNVWVTLGKRQSNIPLLRKARTTFCKGLRGWPRSSSPLGWAKLQHNIGNALYELALLDPNSTAALRASVAAYDAALEERQRDRVPLEWAESIGNQADPLVVLAIQARDPALAERALEQTLMAEETMRVGGHIPHARYYSGQIPKIRAVLSDLRRRGA
jgi:tetratricopeptide (TPR) repeat protein